MKPLDGGVMVKFKDKNIPFNITDGALKCEDIKDEYNFRACTPSYKNIQLKLASVDPNNNLNIVQYVEKRDLFHHGPSFVGL